jgi:hypothetical protein
MLTVEHLTRCLSVVICQLCFEGDEILCESYEQNFGGFLTVQVKENCQLTYESNRLGKQFGQFWLMDRHRNQILSRSLISIQVHVLQDVVCDTQPDLRVENQQDHSNASAVNINQSVYVLVSINPHCRLIDPQDQTITELTTLCTNNQPVILSDGGIEMMFQCQPSLCERYQVCFVGEFGLKLPSTKTQCLTIDVIGTSTSAIHRSCCICCDRAGAFSRLFVKISSRRED